MNGVENPQAFPLATEFDVYSDGMTLRDWFAGQALPVVLTAILNGQMQSEGAHDVNAVAADIAYGISEAMLATRTPKPEGEA